MLASNPLFTHYTILLILYLLNMREEETAKEALRHMPFVLIFLLYSALLLVEVPYVSSDININLPLLALILACIYTSSFLASCLIPRYKIWIFTITAIAVYAMIYIVIIIA